ncbi:Uma2 family endonuclease [Adhaeribacter radiodurans]|uniref:Uma2 family endonuclease n=1 Tax=Adhaeribacter radiodurans TaxID=2745197 RepID=A0A7L7LBB6_9BACT|nr:Uma2 family endonuclease [Adhaeribacter radiodurans]QMU30126.1 Uma2 family endonuclease [Adhaeribacter radiodurans]
MAVQTKKFINPEEYLTAEREAEFKNGYYQGEVFAMSGASFNHNVIAANLLGLLFSLKKMDVRAFGNDLRLHIPLNSLYTYPDVTIICGKPTFLDQQLDTVVNPTVIFEVLSPATEKYDRGKKFMLYRSISALQEYILIDSQYRLIGKYTRNAENHWILTDYKQSEDNLIFNSIPCRLSLQEIYSETIGIQAV